MQEQEKYITEIEQQIDKRSEKVDALRSSGYEAADYDRKKILDIISINPKTGLQWTSTVTNVPVEEITLIIENEPDYVIKNEYIINKKKVPQDSISPRESEENIIFPIILASVPKHNLYMLR